MRAMDVGLRLVEGAWSLRLSRFLLIGMASTALYAVLALALSYIQGIGVTAASILAFGIAAIFSYAGHKYITFVSGGAHRFELPRFLVLTAVGLILVTALPALFSGYFGLPAAVPVLVACLAIPTINFVVLGKWVFATETRIERVSSSRGFEACGAEDGFATARPSFWRNVAGCVAITLFSVLYQTRWGTIPDTSWLITVCERMLNGERLYVEIYETNPPFTIWLYLPPVALARMLDIAPETLVHGWTYLSAMVGFGFACLVVRRADFPESRALFAMAPAFYAMLVVFPGIAFTEREHIGMALFLPLLALLAWRAKPDSPAPGFGLAMLAGASGSVLLLVKPYYALMVLLPALFAAWRRRSLRPIFAPEMWVIGFVCTAYLVAVTSLHPEFIRDVFPILTDTYQKIRSYGGLVLQFGVPWMFLIFLAWRLWPIGRVPELACVAALASVGGMFPLVLQGKGWAYHAYPAILCAILAVMCLLALPASARRAAQWQGAMPRLMKPGPAMVLMGVMLAYAPFSVTQKPGAGMVNIVRSATGEPTIAQIGSDLATGHPLTRMVEGRWTETHVSDWLGTSALLLFLSARHDGDKQEADHYQAMLERYAREKRDEFERVRPDLIAYQTNENGWTELLEERFGFNQIMSKYHVIAEDHDVRIYLRNDYAPAVSRAE